MRNIIILIYKDVNFLMQFFIDFLSLELTDFRWTVLRAQEELEALVGRVGKLLHHIFHFSNFRTLLTWISISSMWIFRVRSGEIQKFPYLDVSRSLQKLESTDGCRVRFTEIVVLFIIATI